MRKELSRIDKPVNKTRWDMSPPTVNAYYSPARWDWNIRLYVSCVIPFAPIFFRWQNHLRVLHLQSSPTHTSFLYLYWTCKTFHTHFSLILSSILFIVQASLEVMHFNWFDFKPLVLIPHPYLINIHVTTVYFPLSFPPGTLNTKLKFIDLFHYMSIQSDHMLLLTPFIAMYL